MRVNLVLGHQLPFPPTKGGGVNNLLWMLAREFCRIGVSVVAYSPMAPELKRVERDAFGIQHCRVNGAPMRAGRWANNLSGLPYSFRLWRALKASDVTSFHAPFSFLLRYRGDIGVCTHTLHRTPKWISRLYGNMDRIYAGSHATAREAGEIAPGSKDRIKAIHNCIELGDACPAITTRTDRDLSLIYVGRFSRDKGLESLISGALDAMDGGTALTVTTVGPQTDQEGGESVFFERVRSAVAGSRHGRRFSFRPSITDRAALFSLIDEHDVFCLPSLSGETFSMAGLEAMARAKPLLTSDYGAMPEMVEHGVTGYLAKAGDRVAWASAIANINAMREQLPKMGAASWDKARREFGVETIARKYVADFEYLMESRT